MRCIVILDWRPLALVDGRLLITQDRATVFGSRREAGAAVVLTRAEAMRGSAYARGHYNVVSLEEAAGCQAAGGAASDL